MDFEVFGKLATEFHWFRRISDVHNQRSRRHSRTHHNIASRSWVSWIDRRKEKIQAVTKRIIGLLQGAGSEMALFYYLQKNITERTRKVDIICHTYDFSATRAYRR